MTQEQTLPAISTIKMDQGGRFLPQSFEDAFRLARMYCASGMLPKRFQTPESVVTAQQYAAELGISGITALRQIAVINGTPALFGDLPLAIVRGKGQLEKIEEFFVTKDGTRISLQNKNIGAEFYAAVCLLTRKGEAEREFVYSIDDAKVAGLWGQNVWKPHPKRMLQMRTRGWGLKDTFADALSGIAQGEYDLNTIIEDVPNEVISTGPLGGAAKLNNLVSVPKEAAPAPEPAPVAVAEPEVLPAEPKAATGFESFQGTTVANTVKAPKLEVVLPSREELAAQIGMACQKLELSMEGLEEKCLKEFSKKPDELSAEEMQVILLVLSKVKKEKAV